MPLRIPKEGEIANDQLNYGDLISQIDEDQIQIPEFQRKFVWTKQKILDLLDSIYKGFPIGSFILWVTKEDFEHSYTIDKDVHSKKEGKFFVIDGQQRIKSLYHAAKCKSLEMKQDNSNKITNETIDIWFDLEEEKFVLKEDILSERFRGVFRVPWCENKDFIEETLNSINNKNYNQIKVKYEFSDNQLYNKLFDSLSRLGLISIKDENSEEIFLTKKGKEYLINKNNKSIALKLYNEVQFIKEVLEIIEKKEKISLNEIKEIFKNEIYKKSQITSGIELNNRIRWFFYLNLINIDKVEDEYYSITELGKEVLQEIREIENEEATRLIPLNRILKDQAEIDWDFLDKFRDLMERRYKLDRLRKHFKNYEFSVIIVNKSDWEDVCEIFERINTQGQHLTVVDLMIAKTWSGERFHLRDELKEFKQELGEVDNLPDITILQSASINICNRVRRSDILGLDKEAVIENWQGTKESIRKALDFYKNNLNIPNLRLLPYPAQLVPINKFFFMMENKEPSKGQIDKLITWFWKSSISNRFASAVETKLAEDGEAMKKIVAHEPHEFRYSYIRRNASDIIHQKYSLQSAFTKTLLCLLLSQRPLNIVNNTLVNFSNFSRYTQSEMHHIFPRHYLEKQGIEAALINSITNIMFIPANINKNSLLKKSPKIYFSQLQKNNPQLKDSLKTHLIYNLEESGLLDDDFDQFTKYKARQILKKLEQVTGEDLIVVEARALQPETPFSNELHLREIIRQCEKYIYWVDKYFTRKGLEYLVEEVSEKDINTIKILSGTAQTTSKLRKDFGKFQEEMKHKGINVELRILTTELLRDIHDRWLITQNQVFIIPSINTIGRGQYAEIIQTPSRPSFESWWQEASDIIKDWNKIQKKLRY